jgi:hypothetical protein
MKKTGRWTKRFDSSIIIVCVILIIFLMSTFITPVLVYKAPEYLPDGTFIMDERPTFDNHIIIKQLFAKPIARRKSNGTSLAIKHYKPFITNIERVIHFKKTNFFSYHWHKHSR